MVSRILKGSLLAVALAMAVTTQGEAQKRGGYLARQGFWIGFGAGYGSLGISCSFCGTDRENGISGMFGIGGTLNPKMTLGLETNGFYKDVSGTTVIDANAGASLHFYPSPTGNLFIRGSLGMSRLSLDDGTDEITSTGFGLGLGLGYDLYLGRSMSITPYFNYLLGLSGEAKLNGQATGEDLKPNLWQVGAALTWH